MSAPTSDPGPRERRVLQGGRLKAYRPLPEAERLAALGSAIEAYERGDHFLAHELLEPAWMGTDDPAERDLYQGLIKLAAGFVHAARGNPAGVATNLRGATERLGRVPESEAVRRGIVLKPLLAATEAALGEAQVMVAARTAGGDGGSAVRRPLQIEPPPLRGTAA